MLVGSSCVPRNYFLYINIDILSMHYNKRDLPSSPLNWNLAAREPRIEVLQLHTRKKHSYFISLQICFLLLLLLKHHSLENHTTFIFLQLKITLYYTFIITSQSHYYRNSLPLLLIYKLHLDRQLWFMLIHWLINVNLTKSL